MTVLRRELRRQFTLSRRHLLHMMGLSFGAFMPSLYAPVTRAQSSNGNTIPSLPQHASAAEQTARMAAVQQAQSIYAFDLRLPNAPRVATLPEAEFFTLDYLNARQARIDALDQNIGAFLFSNPTPFTDRDQWASTFVTLPPVPRVFDYKADSTFASQRTAGVNPMELREARTLSTPLLDRLGLDDDTFRDVLRDQLGHGSGRGVSLRGAHDSGRLFVADYAFNRDIVTPPYKFAAAPIAVYYADRQVGLVPICVQLGQDPSSLLLTPFDGLDWEMAKLVVQAADAAAHELKRHLAQAHLVSESFALSTHRQLPPEHPLYVLLKPHFEFNMAINARGDEALINPGGLVELFLPGTLASSLGFVNASVIEMKEAYAAYALPKDLQRRGLNSSRLASMPYRDDGLLMWHALYDYVYHYLNVYYTSDADIALDYELQNWIGELSTSIAGGGMGITSLPSSLASVSDLVELVTQIIYSTGPHHSAIALTQFENYAFIPSMPLALWSPPPTSKGVAEADLVAALPPAIIPEQIPFALTLGTMRLGGVIGSKFDPKDFGDFGADAFTDPRAIDVHDAFLNHLVRIEDEINDRNTERDTSYTGFLPSVIANSTSN